MNREDLEQITASTLGLKDLIQPVFSMNLHQEDKPSTNQPAFPENCQAEFRQLMMHYACAARTVETRLQILSEEYDALCKRNPIQSISSRLKRTDSLLEKLERIHVAPSIENIQNNIFDIAGVRVTCSYVDDIYELCDALLNQKDIRLIQKKDYIKNPKPNGYRSLHLIISVPVNLLDHRENITVEVQLRTIAMDFWASLEHQLKYKQQVPNTYEIFSKLKECAELIHQADEKMLEIRKQLDAARNMDPDDGLISLLIKMCPETGAIS